jgi:hypothetical protein
MPAHRSGQYVRPNGQPFEVNVTGKLDPHRHIDWDAALSRLYAMLNQLYPPNGHETPENGDEQ